MDGLSQGQLLTPSFKPEFEFGGPKTSMRGDPTLFEYCFEMAGLKVPRRKPTRMGYDRVSC